MQKYIQIFTVIAVWFIAAYVANSCFNSKAYQKENPVQASEPVVIHDTLTVHDTIAVSAPSADSSTKLSTILLPVATNSADGRNSGHIDTITIHDTLYITLPFEQKFYQGNQYQAWVSGYQPSLDSIRLFTSTTQYTTSISTNISTGTETLLYGTDQPKKPSLLTNHFSLGLQIGYGVSINPFTKQIDHTPYIGLGLTYNLFRFR